MQKSIFYYTYHIMVGQLIVPIHVKQVRLINNHNGKLIHSHNGKQIKSQWLVNL